jgi:hypothetical protein
MILFLTETPSREKVDAKLISGSTTASHHADKAIIFTEGGWYAD